MRDFWSQEASGAGVVYGRLGGVAAWGTRGSRLFGPNTVLTEVLQLPLCCFGQVCSPARAYAGADAAGADAAGAARAGVIAGRWSVVLVGYGMAAPYSRAAWRHCAGSVATS